MYASLLNVLLYAGYDHSSLIGQRIYVYLRCSLEKLVDEVIAASPKQVEQYRSGKTAVIGYLVGQVMKASRGQANPQAVNDLFRARLG